MPPSFTFNLRISLLALLAFALSACTADNIPEPSSYIWAPKGAITASGVGDGSANRVVINLQASKYAIFRSTDRHGSFTYLATSTSPVYLDKTVQKGQVYFYKAAAISGDVEVPPPSRREGHPVGSATQDCLTKDKIRELKTLTEISDLRQTIRQLYDECSPILQQRMQFTLKPNEVAFSSAELEMIYAMIVAHMLAPYGYETSDMSLLGILSESTIACDIYAILAGHLYQLIAGDDYTEEIYFDGFDDGAVGNHAQIIFSTPERQLLLDPTTGIVAVVSHEDLLNGTPARHVYSFYGYWGDDEQSWPNIDTYHWTVFNALLSGSYQTEDEIYFYLRDHSFD